MSDGAAYGALTEIDYVLVDDEDYKSITRFVVLRLFAEQTDHFLFVFSVASGFLDIPGGTAVRDDAPSVLLPSSKWLSDKRNQRVMAGHANVAFAGWTADSASHIGKWMQAYEICVEKNPVVKRGGAAKRVEVGRGGWGAARSAQSSAAGPCMLLCPMIPSCK
jgi:hypothetical protein